MFIGHFGAGLAGKKAAPGNIWVRSDLKFFTSALFYITFTTTIVISSC